MRPKTSLKTTFAVALTLIICSHAMAQQPQSSDTPQLVGANIETTVYVKHEYAEQMKATGLFEGDKIVGDKYYSGDKLVSIQRQSPPMSVLIPTDCVLCVVTKFHASNK